LDRGGCALSFDHQVIIGLFVGAASDVNAHDSLAVDSGVKPIDGRTRRPALDEEKHVRRIYRRSKSFRETERLTGVGRRVIARIVRGVASRPMGDHAIATTPQLDRQIIARYDELRSSRLVAGEFDLCAHTVRKIVKRGTGRRLRPGGLKFAVHDAVFDEPLTEEAAYWIGFIGADGVIIRKPGHRQAAIQIGLASKDRAHLERFLAFVSPGRRVHDTSRMTDGKRHGLSLACVPSDRLVAACARYGIVHGKTYSMPDFKPPDTQQAAFWRGWVDGDGCVSIDKRGYLRTNLTGLPVVVNAYAAWAHAACGVELRVRPIGHCPWLRVGWLAGHHALPLLRVLYDGAALYLPRKYAKWQDAEARR
jgi:hypothetical protein